MPESSSPTVFSLSPHPANRPGAIEALDIEVRRVAGSLVLDYRLRADPEALRLPPAVTPRRADGLWRHTCLEAFVRPAGGAGYLEFNFSPSGEWAAYRFEARREGMQPLELPREPETQFTHLPQELRLQAEVLLPASYEAPLRLGLAAVVEAADGTLGYWALRHGPGAPDFHDPESFTLRLGTDATDVRA